MKGDFSRFSFDPKRNVRTVTVQQGRVLTDADINETSEATLRRIETDTLDTFGPAAASVGTGGFKILPEGGGQPARVSAGRLYVEGLQLENHADVPLPALTGTGRRLIYVKAIVDHITGVEDGLLRDAALGDADTAGRAIVRTEILALDALAADACATPNAQFDALRAPSGGLMTVTLTPAASSSDPCKLTPDSGYARLENLLYRCEVHDGTLAGGIADHFNLAGVKIKLSRNNACELSRISAVNGNRITLASASKDGLPVFRGGEYVELLPVSAPYDAVAFGPLTRIDDVQDDVLVVTDPTGAVAGGRIRLWSQDVVTLGGGNKISVDGLDFTFSGSNFRKGDYWVAPGRYALHDLDPTVQKGVPLPPVGPRIAYAKLGLLTVNNGTIDPTSIVDCRPLFVPLTQSVELEYAGGDGQSIRPPSGPGAAALTDPLPSALRAIVRIGHQPVAGSRVIFSIVLPGPAVGTLTGSGAGGAITGTQIEVLSGADGVAQVTWALSSVPTAPVQRVTATLLTDANPGQLPPPPLHYTAELDFASGVAYQPGACTALQGQTTVQGALDKLCNDFANLTASQIIYETGKCVGLDGAKNVQEALDKLCLDILNIRQSECIIVTEVVLPNSGRRLDNNESVKPEELLQGFLIRFDDKIATHIEDGFEPIARLALDMPFPSGRTALFDWSSWLPARDGAFAFGTSPVYLSGTIAIESNTLTWKPQNSALTFLKRANEHQFGLNWGNEPRVIFEERYIKGWITLRGDSIWASEGPKRRYLNGEMMRFPTDNNPFSIFGDDGSGLKPDEQIRSRLDPQRAGDFELWFKLPLG